MGAKHLSIIDMSTTILANEAGTEVTNATLDSIGDSASTRRQPGSTGGIVGTMGTALPHVGGGNGASVVPAPTSDNTSGVEEEALGDNTSGVEEEDSSDEGPKDGFPKGTKGALVPPLRDVCKPLAPKSITGVFSTPCPAAVRKEAFSPQDLDPRDPVRENVYPEPVRLDAVRSRQYIRLEANGLQVMGIPDTGSTINFMSTAMYRREFSHLPLRQMRIHRAKGVTGKDREMGVNTEGLVQLRVRYCGKAINANFLVGEFHDSRTLILGEAWQDRMQLNVGYDLRGNLVVYMDHRVVPSYTLWGGKFTAMAPPEGRALNLSFRHPSSLLESGHTVGTSLEEVSGVSAQNSTPQSLCTEATMRK